MKKLILVLNAGSATLKFKIFNNKMEEILSGNLERIGLTKPFLSTKEGNKKQVINFKKGVKNHQEALNLIYNNIDFTKSQIGLIGHRLVHGGSEFSDPVVLNQKVIKRLEKYNEIAPLHNPPGLMVVKASMKIFKGVKNAAVFDTAYYKNLPDKAAIYPIPLELTKRFKIRRFGFHGPSHKYVSLMAAKKIGKPIKKLNLITCHLGSGCSITAIKSGKPIDTSMGLTPLDGLMMATRSGDIDPALVIFLQEKLKKSPRQILKLLNSHSGIKGIFNFQLGIEEVTSAAGYKTPDYKLNKKFSRSEKEKAKLALELYVYRIQKYIFAYAGILGKVDAIIFTGGVGERSPIIRKMVRSGLGVIKNVKYLVVHTNEELMIAREIKKFG